MSSSRKRKKIKPSSKQEIGTEQLQTQDKSKIKYARVLIEMNINKPIPNTLTFMDERGDIIFIRGLNGPNKQDVVKCFMQQNKCPFLGIFKLELSKLFVLHGAWLLMLLNIRGEESECCWMLIIFRTTRVFSRLDRVSINGATVHKYFDDIYYEVLHEGVSNHCPLLVHLKANHELKWTQFKFFNM
ncbi:hypothetical protein Cgig2_026151 [Carnegiea gigantea]|uniref:Uncharacterized protein n=1 Tax=Carnegiea gigantea TaxID=171969 RepID=A0A9Q1JPG4_9CARY|nr:hypothetical protein Cgig2_026151 [Carnegiea gigantea]